MEELLRVLLINYKIQFIHVVTHFTIVVDDMVITQTMKVKHGRIVQIKQVLLLS